MSSTVLFLGAISAFLGVAMGAFGAHSLKAVLTPELLAVYQTGVQYHLCHSLGLIALALLRLQAPASKLLNWASWLMFSGIVLFSGSLYLLAILNEPQLGMITPLGGICFLTAWLLIAVFAAKKPAASASSISAPKKQHGRYH